MSFYKLFCSYVGALFQILKTNSFKIAVCFIIALGLLIRIKLFLYNRPLWLDELMLANNIIYRDFFSLFKPLDNIQVAPTFFLLFTKLILKISPFSSDIFYRDMIIRILPFVSSLISILLFVYLVNKLFKNKYFTCISTLMFSFNTNLIMFSGEFKQYSVEVLFSLILLNAFFTIDLKNDSSSRETSDSFSFVANS